MVCETARDENKHTGKYIVINSRELYVFSETN